MIQAVLFDIDGTLTDTNPIFLKALQQTYLEFQGEEKPLSFFHFSLGIPSPRTIKILGIPEAERMLFRDRWQELIREWMPQAQLFPGIFEILHQIALWKIPMALVTAKIREEMVYEFNQFEIHHFFAVTVCADDVAHPKPAPDSLLVASEKIAVSKEQVIFVGESTYDAQAAKNAGIRFAFARWGALNPQEILSLDPDYILEKPSDLLKLLAEENTLETRGNLQVVC